MSYVRNAGWGMKWSHWDDNELCVQIFWTKREAIDEWLKAWYTPEEIDRVGRSVLWRRLKRKGCEVVKVRLVRGWE